MSDSSENSVNTYARSALLGVVSGMRSTLPLALQSWLNDSEEQDLQIPFLPQVHITPSTLRTITSVISIGELFGDKAPGVPSRISPGPLVGRLALGAFAGMVLARKAKQSPVIGALLGAAGAGVGSFAGYYGRSGLKRVTHLPDPLLGAAEDALALGLGTLALRGAK